MKIHTAMPRKRTKIDIKRAGFTTGAKIKTVAGIKTGIGAEAEIKREVETGTETETGTENLSEIMIESTRKTVGGKTETMIWKITRIPEKTEITAVIERMIETITVATVVAPDRPDLLTAENGTTDSTNSLLLFLPFPGSPKTCRH
eukprot:scpid67668/ scgid4646/ 